VPRTPYICIVSIARCAKDKALPENAAQLATHSAARLLCSHIGSIGLGHSAGDALCARQLLGLPRAASAEEFTPGEQRGAMARTCINRACLDPLGKVLLWIMFLFFLTINSFFWRFAIIFR
jgi:hypothetical protein